jgi:hypothetical protein
MVRYRLATCILVCCALAATAATGGSLRVPVAPGASLAFGPGWVVCANSVADGRYNLAGIPRSNCGGAGNAIQMRYMGSGQPVDLWLRHVDDVTASESLLKAAPPERIAAMSDHLCTLARSQPGYDVGSCRWDIGTLAGHTVFLGHGTVTAVNDPLKLKYEFIGFSAPDATGYLTVMATTPVMVRKKTDTVIDGLLATLAIDAPAPPPPSPPAQMISLAPAPGVSFQIPDDWIACDDPTEALLHSARDSMKMKDKICAASPNVPSILRAFDPRLLHMVSMSFNYHKHQSITPDALADMAQADLDTVRQNVCASEGRFLSGPVMDCQLVIGNIAGHRALISSIVRALPDGAKGEIVIYEVPYALGYMQIQFSHADIVSKLVQPEIDAILATLRIDDAATVPDPGATDDKKAPAPPPQQQQTPPVPKSSI